MIQSIVAEINIKTGESECHYYKERLLYLEESQRDLLIDSSRILSCHGELKNNRGAVSVVHLYIDLFTCPSHPGKICSSFSVAVSELIILNHVFLEGYILRIFSVRLTTKIIC